MQVGVRPSSLLLQPGAGRALRLPLAQRPERLARPSREGAEQQVLAPHAGC